MATTADAAATPVADAERAVPGSLASAGRPQLPQNRSPARSAPPQLEHVDREVVVIEKGKVRPGAHW